jgi:hypothetical protein
VAANPGPAAAASSEGIAENVAGLLCYILSWLSGLIFLLIDKRPFVRFHAAQSIALSVAIFVVYFAVAIVSACSASCTWDFWLWRSGHFLASPYLSCGFS